MAEMLIVVGIIVVLMGVAAVGIIVHLRGLAKVEYDGYAREIFVAAQNHLTMAESQGYLGRTEFGGDDSEDGVYYFVVNVSGDTPEYTSVTDNTTVLNLMLPTGSVDETVRLGGKYIVRYHRASAQVLDVFYWETSGRYAHTYDNNYSDFLSKRGDKNALKTYTDSSVIGYYGGVDAANLTWGEKLTAPTISVTNAERLTVTVTDNSSDAAKGTAGYTLRLVITGKQSGAVKTVVLTTRGADSTTYSSDGRFSGTGPYTYILDDVTDVSGANLHFANLAADSGTFIPGEDITLKAVASNSAVLTNVAESSTAAVNSLFGDGTAVNGADSTAVVSNVRHLENLSQDISNVNDSASTVQYTSARQTVDLSWPVFKAAMGDSDLSVTTADYYPALSTGTASAKGTFMPVNPAAGLDYDGQNHSITRVTVSVSGAGEHGGLFGSFTGGSISNLTLVDFSVAAGGTGLNAGALAGSVSGTTVSNVLAYNSAAFDSASAPTVTGTGSVGGLVGSATNGSTVTGSAAALVVSSSGSAAGGLIGSVSGGSVTNSYSGGHTVNGAYSTTAYNVTADSGSAGGLLGVTDGAAVTGCYSTCSASGGATSGGLLGNMGGGSIANSYSVGLVGGSGNKGALVGWVSSGKDGGSAVEISGLYLDIGSYSGSPVSACNLAGGLALQPLAGGENPVRPMDFNTSVFSDATPATGAAVPYDNALKVPGNSGTTNPTYHFKTVAQLTGDSTLGGHLSTHYGDWPLPETTFINTRS